MTDVEEAVRNVLERHPAVLGVRLIGSRAYGQAHALSDWDFSVETEDFAAVSRDLPELTAGLGVVAAQWDRYSRHACYMLVLPGPVKIDLLFPGQRQAWSGPWDVTGETMGAVDVHFWDWILWLEQKRRGGKDDVLRASLEHMHALLLGPMGVPEPPHSVAQATRLYLTARAELEQRYGREVSRGLERVVRPALEA